MRIKTREEHILRTDDNLTILACHSVLHPSRDQRICGMNGWAGVSPKGVYIRRHENLRGAVDNDERTRAILGADITGTLMRLAECGGLGSDGGRRGVSQRQRKPIVERRSTVGVYLLELIKRRLLASIQISTSLTGDAGTPHTLASF